MDMPPFTLKNAKKKNSGNSRVDKSLWWTDQGGLAAIMDVYTDGRHVGFVRIDPSNPLFETPIADVAIARVLSEYNDYDDCRWFEIDCMHTHDGTTDRLAHALRRLNAMAAGC